MQRCIVLDLRSLTELDPLIVAAQDGSVPDARFGLESHTTNDHRGFGDVVMALTGKFRRLSVELINWHSSLRSAARTCLNGMREGSVSGVEETTSLQGHDQHET